MYKTIVDTFSEQVIKLNNINYLISELSARPQPSFKKMVLQLGDYFLCETHLNNFQKELVGVIDKIEYNKKRELIDNILNLINPLVENGFIVLPPIDEFNDFKRLEYWVDVDYDLEYSLKSVIYFRGNSIFKHVLFLIKTDSEDENIYLYCVCLLNYFKRLITLHYLIPIFHQDNYLKSVKIENQNPTIELLKTQEAEYIEKWLNSSTSLNDWLNYPLINILKLFYMTDADDITLLNVKLHQYKLYKQFVEIYFTNNYKNLIAIPDKNIQIPTAIAYLKLINNLISGNVQNDDVEKILTIFKVNNWRSLRSQIEYVKIHTIYNDNNFNIHSSDSFIIAESILLFQEYLSNFIIATQGQTSIKVNILNATEKNTNIATIINTQISTSLRYVNYDTDYNNINMLFKYCISKKLIHIDSKITDFRKIFSGEEVINPIIWIEKITQLHYFIKLLVKNKKIEDCKQMHWFIASNCFVNSDKIKFNPEEIKNKKTPANTQLIGSAVDLL